MRLALESIADTRLPPYAAGGDSGGGMMFAQTMSFVSILSLLFLVPGTPQGSESVVSGAEDRVAITKVLTVQEAAWNDGDVAGFMRGYWNSPELTFAGSNGFSKGWSKVSDRYRERYPDKAAMGHLEFTIEEVRLLDKNAALVLGKWHLARVSGDVGGIFTLVFQRFPDGWKIVHDHTS
jgi:ketosteroid isomerase-like protein